MGSSRPHTAGLAEKLCEIRTRLGLSQAQMVRLLKEQSLPSPPRVYSGNISRFEQGLREPPLLVLLAYARAAGVAVDVLIDARLELPDRLVPGREGELTQRGGARNIANKKKGKQSAVKKPKTVSRGSAR
jgi:transcriptional regulator with XRE-family HTH domain